MSKSEHGFSPPPRGAGAGGGGRSIEPDPPIVRESNGWSPRVGEHRQKEHKRANSRARRLRKALTPSEKKLWRMLRELPDAHFRKQVALGDFVYDFAEYRARLLIELDGGVHDWPDVALRDLTKAEAAKAAGFNLLRLNNDDVWSRPDWVLDQVRQALRIPHPLPPPHKGEGEKDAI